LRISYTTLYLLILGYQKNNIMSRLTLFAAAITMLSACNKKGDYTCTCTTGTSIIEKQTYTGVTAHTANKRCEALETKHTQTPTSRSVTYTQCGLY
jgi:hypothetical protein